MLSEAFATDQIARLSQLRGFPRDEKALDELVLALRGANSEKQAEEVVDLWIRGVEHMACPEPADIRLAVHSAKQAAIEYTLDKNVGELCARCQSLGHFLSEGKQVRCDCIAGQEFPQNLLDMMNSPEQANPKRRSPKNEARLSELLQR